MDSVSRVMVIVPPDATKAVAVSAARRRAIEERTPSALHVPLQAKNRMWLDALAETLGTLLRRNKLLEEIANVDVEVLRADGDQLLPHLTRDLVALV